MMSEGTTTAIITAVGGIVLAYFTFRSNKFNFTNKHEDVLSDLIKQQTEMINSLREQVIQFQVENKQLKETVDKQNKVIDNLTAEVGQLREQISELKSRTKEA